ncbi:hypothetical protein OJ997_02515 [Solirubrobacter phytolaccae]|uniref:Uncharacterized protein n=1 Tax=Solirubrobacter phytolaccae TaxID=1404360 RepID=A0A9X3N3I0_9ACTN|nr:hypothetical protein [Solirubrobacter phytolaccae]
MFTAQAGDDERLAQLFSGEDIELVLDLRSEAEGIQIARTCVQIDTYYVSRPSLLEAKGREGDTWAAGLALRHRTCLIGGPDESRRAVARRIAESAGQRVIDLDLSPAPIVFSVK